MRSARISRKRKRKAKQMPEQRKIIKNNACWDCLHEYRCDWMENISGSCRHFTPDTTGIDTIRAKEAKNGSIKV